MIPAEETLLCESCGYDIGGIDASHNCPECGRSITSSLPEVRTGSAWQIRPGIRSWADTSYLMLRRPGAVFDRLRMDERGLRALMLVNLTISGLLLALPFAGVFIGDPARNARGLYGWLILGRSVSIGTIAVAVGLFLLTMIEAMGIMFFGRRRGWRITREIAWQICAHASIGWVLSAAFTLLALVIWLNISYFGLSGYIERAGRAGDYLLAAVPLLGFFTGMFIFELLVYIGMRRCRFANAPRDPAA